MSQKHIVVQGAVCKCSFGNQSDKLKVSHTKKEYINDADGTTKLVATALETGQPFENKTFGSCKKTGSKCVPAITEWKDFYKKITLSNGGKVLVEDSKAICVVGVIPCVSFETHGQTAELSQIHFNNCSPQALAVINPLMPANRLRKELPKVKQIQASFKRSQSKEPIKSQKQTDSNNNASPKQITVPINEPINFEVIDYYNKSKSDKTKVGWKIINAHTFEGETETFEETGPSFNTSFDVIGKYRIVAFGGQDPNKQNDIKCSFDITVADNALADNIQYDKANVSIVKDQYRLRRGVPTVFRAAYNFEPTDAERARVQMMVTDIANNPVVPLTPAGVDHISFTPTNTAAVYTVTAVMAPLNSAEKAQEVSQTFHSQANGVVKVTCAQGEKVRLHTNMVFEATELTYNTLIQDFEIADIKWVLNGVEVGRGKTLHLNGAKYLRTLNKYVVEAYVVKSNSWDYKNKKPAPHETDDWNFEVIANEITALEAPTKWITGIDYTITAKTFFKYNPALDGPITWIGAVPIANEPKQATSKALKAGTFQVTAVMGKLTKPLVITATYAHIQRWCFAYLNKDVHKESSIGLKTYLHAIIDGLTNEEVEVCIWEHNVEYNIFHKSTYKMDLKKTFKANLTNGELFVEISPTEDIWKQLSYERNRCQILFTLKRSGVIQNIQFNPGEVKEYQQGHALYGHIFPVTNKRDIGMYLIMTPDEKILEACFVNANDKKLYSVIQYGQTAHGLVKTTGFKPGTKIKVALVENLVNDKQYPSDPLANGQGEIPVDDDGRVRIAFKTKKEVLGEHNKYVKNLSAGTPRTFYMAIYHKESKILFPTDVGDSDITNNVAKYFEIAKVMAELSKTKDPAKYIFETTAAVVKRNYFLQLKVADIASQNQLLKTIAPVVLGEPLDQEATTSNTTCVCQQYDLIWGKKVSCEFRKKLVEICKELWPNDYKNMANGLMAVMNVETAGHFKAHMIEGKTLKEVNEITKSDFNKTINGKQSSRAVGLIQFTQKALVSLGEFKDGEGFDKLHEVKLRFAQMGEIKQLDYVKKYFLKTERTIKTPEDIYLAVFAPTGIDRNDNFVLYEKGTTDYDSNKSIDKENNNDGKIQRSEILARYHNSFKEGEKHKEDKFSCGIVSKSEKQLSNQEDGKWHDPIDYPQRTYYNSNGAHKEQNGAFGPVRLNSNGTKKNHQGLDLFADINTPCKACLKGEIVHYVNEGNSGYGNVLVLKVKGEDLRKSKREYSLEFKDEVISGEGFDINADEFYLRYAHLSSAVKTSGTVEAGETICYTGDTGNAHGVPNPHLHFEVNMKKSGNGSGLSNRYNPAFFVRLKPINEPEQTKVKNKRS